VETWSANQCLRTLPRMTNPLFHMFKNFLAIYEFVGCFIQDSSDLRYVITNVVKELKAQHIVYAELTISIADYLENGMILPDVMQCLAETAKQSDIHLQWIVDLGRDQGSLAALDLLNQILALQCESIVGITLGGNERKFPPERFAEVYTVARDHGLGTTIHAGEILGPNSIWDVLRILKVDRIGHGVRAIEDEQLMAYLAARPVPLEICPTSNIWTGIFPSYHAHPLKLLFEAGVPITINTDNPTFFDVTLADEYTYVSMTTGLQADAIFEMVKNGFRYAFLPQEDITHYLHDLDQAWQEIIQQS
jgi:adenosine deaminase